MLLAAAACNPTPTTAPITLSPNPTPTTAGGLPIDGSTVEALPCEEASATATEAEEYLAALPEPPIVPGAGEEVEELNPGEVPVTFIDPQAAVAADAALAEAVIPVRPIGAQDQPGDVIRFQQPLTIPNGSQVAEPNIAVNGSRAFLTWNWFAGRSTDGLASYQPTDPFSQLSAEDGTLEDGGFCCDQLVQYIPSFDMWIWVLQSSTPDSNGENTGGNRIRLKVARGDGGFTHTYDLVSSGAGLPGDVWFDQTKIGSSAGHLFLSINVYTPSEDFVAAIVYRLSLADLAADATTVPSCFTTLNQRNGYGRPLFGLVPVRLASETMYLGAHFDNARLGIWRWPDDSPSPTFHVAYTSLKGDAPGYPIPTRQDSNGNVHYDYRCPVAGGGAASDWCGGSNDRITSAWAADEEIGFAWNVGQDPSSNWPYPSVFVVILDAARLQTCAQGSCVIAKPNIRSRAHAFQFAAITSNSRGELGLVALYGGGEMKQSCALGARDRDSAPTDGFDYSDQFYASDRHTAYGESGHYLGIWPGPTGGSWTAGCMTLHEANTQRNRPSSVHFSYFGRRVDAP